MANWPPDAAHEHIAHIRHYMPLIKIWDSDVCNNSHHLKCVSIEYVISNQFNCRFLRFSSYAASKSQRRKWWGILECNPISRVHEMCYSFRREAHSSR